MDAGFSTVLLEIKELKESVGYVKVLNLEDRLSRVEKHLGMKSV
jgi:hypothetical protein